jgi:hypothetical protein
MLQQAFLFMAKNAIASFSSFTCYGDLLTKSGLTNVFILDSSTIPLPSGATEAFPATGTANAEGKKKGAVKVSVSFGLKTGTITNFLFTPGTTHDSKAIPIMAFLANCLYIFDLGYYDYGLISAIVQAGALFLCRLKSSSVAIIEEVILDAGSLKEAAEIALQLERLSVNSIVKYHGDYIDCMVRLGVDPDAQLVRAVGCWNEVEQKYHWYITNLILEASIIWMFYKLRWQVELLFKKLKSCFFLKQLTSEKPVIVENLIMVSIIAHLISMPLANEIIEEQPEKKQAQTLLRAGSFLNFIAMHFFLFVTTLTTQALHELYLQARKFIGDLIDPNWRRRPTSAMRAVRALSESEGNPAKLQYYNKQAFESTVKAKKCFESIAYA